MVYIPAVDWQENNGRCHMAGAERQRDETTLANQLHPMLPTYSATHCHTCECQTHVSAPATTRPDYQHRRQANCN